MRFFKFLLDATIILWLIEIIPYIWNLQGHKLSLFENNIFLICLVILRILQFGRYEI